jgi:hypothetical protein
MRKRPDFQRSERLALAGLRAAGSLRMKNSAYRMKNGRGFATPVIASLAERGVVVIEDGVAKLASQHEGTPT